ncbi:transcriptional regulator [Streptococcus salivarius]|jgi:cytoskeletal protein RodZ|uniref:transcriptional regulator n=1 Tax=Streptococcus salivarius TaxID=1304 RepID=UPI001C8B4943|nr:transcriptional regulator [Streptococcus salivarius]MBX8960832.1 transcriptional regulator [Streptococcus salivarius]
MKTTSKFIGSVLALIIVILAIFLVTKFNSHESARVSTSSSPAKTVKKSSSSSSKVVKKDKKSAQSSTSAVSNEENDNQASAVSPKASSQSQAGTTDGGQVADSTTPASQVGGVEGGRGAWTATSGTLTLDEETPVYAAPDKDSGAVSTLPAGDVDWDKYEILPDGNWYSFVKDGQRYYISYSDVGH